MTPCFECGQPSHNNHHVVPRILGGTRTVPLCVECHALVHDRKSVAHPTLIREGLRRARERGVRLGPPQKLTVEVGADILRLAREGMSVPRIAAEVGLSRWPVDKFLRDNGIKPAREPRRDKKGPGSRGPRLVFTPDEPPGSDILALRGRGISLARIAAEVGLSTPIVTRFVRAQGLEVSRGPRVKPAEEAA